MIAKKIGGDKMKLPEQKTMTTLIKGSDLNTITTKVKITNVELRTDLNNPYLEIDGKKHNPIITMDKTFGDDKNQLALNKTNYNSLFKAFGDDSDKWIGKTITLVKHKVNNPQTGSQVDGISIGI